MSASTLPDGVVVQAQGRLRLLATEVEQEPWKKAHDRRNKCFTFETTLEFGVALYDVLIGVDELLRGKMVGGEIAHDPEIDKVSQSLFEAWLTPCAKVETQLRDFERDCAPVEHSAEFRKRYAEAVWMLKPAKTAFADPKMVATRDLAIEELRSGTAK